MPDQVVAHFRARGVFRRLALTSEPLYLTDVPEGSLPRLVIPVRAGGEWLGSIWAVVDGPVAPDRVDEPRNATSVLALHLLHLRAQAGMARRASTDRLRAALQGAPPPDPADRGWLPSGPWRVVAVGAAAAAGGLRATLDLWESITRRFGWHHPLLADLDDGVYALVTDQGGPGTAGSSSWLRSLIGAVHPHDSALTAAAGGLAVDRSDLPRSRSEATELRQVMATEHWPRPMVQIEDAWDAVVFARARAAVQVDSGLLGGPLPALVAHDREYGTDYVRTLSAWLQHFGDPKRAAAALHIHPNTLRYRCDASER